VRGRRDLTVAAIGTACLATSIAAGTLGIARARAAATPDPATGQGRATAAASLLPAQEPAVLHARPIPQQASRNLHLTPLRRLTAPDVIVGLDRPVRPAALRRLRHHDGIAAVAAVDRGVVRIAGERLHAIGVDPNRVRGFTPALTARSRPLWQSVGRGEATVAYGAAQPLKHDLGQSLAVRGPDRHAATVRIGAFASVGLGAAQVVVDQATSKVLGLGPPREVFVSAPHLSIDTIDALVHAALGGNARTVTVRPQTVDQSTMSSYAAQTIPTSYLSLYRSAAATCPGLPWTVLAGIGEVETGHGSNVHTSTKGAEGPMQFLPSTFAAYGVDADGDGVANIQDPADAVFSAARYLCAAGAGRGGQALYDAIWAYNHADWYVRLVLQYAVAYSP
jgi:hypothetical protein